MAGKNVSKGGRLPGFFEDYGGYGIVPDKPIKIPSSSKPSSSKPTPKKPAPKKG